MPKQLTFIHAADLHLGAPFRGLRALSDSWARRLESAIPEAYDRVIKAALDRRVDFVILAGDIFDTARPSYADFLHFFEGMRVLDAANIPVYLVTGNHDPYTSWRKDFAKLPDNVHVFGADKPTFEVYERDGEPLCLLGGRGYYNQTWPQDKDVSEGIWRENAIAALSARVGETFDARAERVANTLDAHAEHAAELLGARAADSLNASARARRAALEAAPFAVSVIHTGLDVDKKAPTNPQGLLGRGIDYWACGHIHKRSAYPSFDDPRVVFSGCIQGRDIKESGTRGCYAVTLEEGKSPALEYIPTASVVWKKMKVDVSDCQTLVDVHDKILRSMFAENGKAECEEMVVRITLTGETHLHETLQVARIIEDLRESINSSYAVFFCDTLIDSTTAPIDKQALLNEELFPALFMNIAANGRQNIDEYVAALQEDFIELGIAVPAVIAKHMDKYIVDAENMVLDLLIEEQK